MATYWAARDIAAEGESTTGTKFDIAATDQIRPIASTTAMIHASIFAFPLRRIELADIFAAPM